jgi:hypothetical protein
VLPTLDHTRNFNNLHLPQQVTLQHPLKRRIAPF